MNVDATVAHDLHLYDALKAYQPYSVMGRDEKLFCYLPEEKDAWQHCMDEQEEVHYLLKKAPSLLPRLEKGLKEIPSPYPLLDKLCYGENLSFTDWFNMKHFLWCLYSWATHMTEMGAKTPLSLSDKEQQQCEQLLWQLNPKPPLTRSFSLDSAYDARLQEKRKQLQQLEQKREQKKERAIEEIEKKYALPRNVFGEWIVAKKDPVNERLQNESLLKICRETTEDLFYHLVLKEQWDDQEEVASLQMEIRHIEEEVMQNLSTFFRSFDAILREAARKIIHFDLLWARIRAGQSWQGVRPVLSQKFCCRGAFHPYVQQSLQGRGSTCTPIDFEMKQGVAVIIGPNMGGKTVALKTMGVIALLAQLGFYVPATHCELPLFPWVGTVLHDGQQLMNGLSSYGAEVTRLQTWLDQAGPGLLLMDELGRSTNPIEGSALVRAVTMFLRDQSKWSILVTHYREVIDVEGLQGYRIKGIEECPLENVPQKEMAEVLEKQMDYRLVPMKPGDDFPQQALWIAQALGLDERIIVKAQSLCSKVSELIKR